LHQPPHRSYFKKAIVGVKTAPGRQTLNPSIQLQRKQKTATIKPKILKHFFNLKISSLKQNTFQLFIALLVLIVLLAGCLQPKNKKFNSSEWKANEKVRFPMLDDIVNNKILIGKSKKELLENLGQPFIKEENFYDGKAMQFRTSEKDGEYLHWYLFVELKNDTVIYTQKSLD